MKVRFVFLSRPLLSSFSFLNISRAALLQGPFSSDKKPTKLKTVTASTLLSSPSSNRNYNFIIPLFPCTSH